MAESERPNDGMAEAPGPANVGEMHPRRETMADGRRYIIYYTFGEQPEVETTGESEAGEDV